MFRHLALLLLGVAGLSAAPAADTGKPVALLNGRDLAAWTYTTLQPTPITAVCHYRPDGSLAITGRPLGFLATRETYRNFRYHVEWRWPANAPSHSNSGILVNIASGPKDRVWPLSIQIQTKLTRAGDILPMAGATFAEKLSTPPGAKIPQLFRRGPSSEKPAGQWNACDVIARNGTIAVVINGVLQNYLTNVSPAAGRVGLQLEGWPYEVRNVTIERLK